MEIPCQRISSDLQPTAMTHTPVVHPWSAPPCLNIRLRHFIRPLDHFCHCPPRPLDLHRYPVPSARPFFATVTVLSRPLDHFHHRCRPVLDPRFVTVNALITINHLIVLYDPSCPIHVSRMSVSSSSIPSRRVESIPVQSTAQFVRRAVQSIVTCPCSPSSVPPSPSSVQSSPSPSPVHHQHSPAQSSSPSLTPPPDLPPDHHH